MDLVDAFLKQGSVVNIKLGLSIVEEFKDELCFCSGSEAFNKLRLEKKCTNKVYERIVDRAIKGFENIGCLSTRRRKAFNDNIERLIPKQGQDATRKHTGQSDSEEESSEEEEGVECTKCEEAMPEYHCIECNSLYCEDCKCEHELKSLEGVEWDDILEIAEKIKK